MICLCFAHWKWNQSVFACVSSVKEKECFFGTLKFHRFQQIIQKEIFRREVMEMSSGLCVDGRNLRWTLSLFVSTRENAFCVVIWCFGDGTREKENEWEVWKERAARSVSVCWSRRAPLLHCTVHCRWWLHVLVLWHCHMRYKVLAVCAVVTCHVHRRDEILWGKGELMLKPSHKYLLK